MKNRLLLLILLDAFRADYLQRTRWLSNLAQVSLRGKLREAFGFLAREAYFGGLKPEERGFTHMFCYDPARSPFGVARGLAWVDEHGGELANEARKWITQVARGRVPSFAAAYVSTLEMPFRFLPYFDPVEKYAPWEPQCGYTSLFSQLEGQGLKWLQCSWPLTNLLPRRDDDGIIDHVIDQLQPEHRVAFVHLQQLDLLGHLHGPGSCEVQRGIEAIDRLVNRLVERAQQIFDSVDVMIFGDHGMVSVVQRLDLWSLLDKSGLRVGHDYVYFLDSTMARFWFLRPRARQTIIQLLNPLREGHVLQREHLQKFHIAGCDRRNAELIFLVHPGVIIQPNFFQRSGQTVRGMHGYDPDCADNMGLFLLHAPHVDHGEIETIDAWQIYFTALDLLERPLPQGTESLSAVRMPRSLQHGRYTRSSNPAAETLVEDHLNLITSEIIKRCPQTAAIVLAGGFGRGEGGVYTDEQGQLKPVNDYDLMVLNTTTNRADLKVLGERLAREIGIDYVDIGCLDSLADPASTASPDASTSMFAFDLSYGHQVIKGSAEVTDKLPKYAPVQIPLREGLTLLLNRAAGLMLGLKGFVSGAQLDGTQTRFLSNQVIKALIALGDWYLLSWGDYDTSYVARRQRFATLASAVGLPSELIERVVQAYGLKVEPDYGRMADIRRHLFELLPYFTATIAHAVGVLTGSQPKDLAEAMRLYHNHNRSAADNLDCLRRRGEKAWAQPSEMFAQGAVGIRPALYAAIVLLLAALVEDAVAIGIKGDYLKEGECWLAALIPLKSWEEESKAWEGLREEAVGLWEELCH